MATLWFVIFATLAVFYSFTLCWISKSVNFSSAIHLSSLRILPSNKVFLVFYPQSALSGNSTSQSNSAPDIVQQALDKTFNTLPRPSTSKAAITRPPVLGVITIGKPPPRPVPRWAHENFLESLPPIDSKFILNDAGNVETMSSVDHDYGQVLELFWPFLSRSLLWANVLLFLTPQTKVY